MIAAIAQTPSKLEELAKFGCLGFENEVLRLKIALHNAILGPLHLKMYVRGALGIVSVHRVELSELQKFHEGPATVPLLN